MCKRLKHTLLILILLPFFSSAQKFYLQAGAGYQFPSSSANKAYAVELSTGVQLNPHFRVGVGISFMDYKGNLEAPYVPVFVDLKLLGSGKIKPYVFFQPGFCIYKSNTYIYIDDNGDELDRGYMKGSFCSNQGLGIIYKYAFLQAGFRYIIEVPTSPYDQHNAYGQYTFGVTAGIGIP